MKESCQKNWRCELLIPWLTLLQNAPSVQKNPPQNIYCNPPKSLTFVCAIFVPKNHVGRPRFGVVSPRHRKTTLFKNSQALSCLGKHRAEAKNGNLSPGFTCCCLHEAFARIQPRKESEISQISLKELKPERLANELLTVSKI